MFLLAAWRVPAGFAAGPTGPPAYSTAPATEPAEQAATQSGAQAIAAWIEQLGDSSFVRRQEAEQKLLEVGTAAQTQLQRAAADADPERASRAQDLLDHINVPPSQRPYLKDYQAPGTRIRAGFIPYKGELVWGEPLAVTFIVENLGPADFQFSFGGDDRGTGRHDRFQIVVTDAAGQPVVDPQADNPISEGGGLGWSPTLKPGKTFSETFNLTTYRRIDKPGQYGVDCRFALEKGFGRRNPDELYPVVRSTFPLTLLQRTPERVAKVLDELVAKGAQARGEDLASTLNLIAQFGQEEGTRRLIGLAAKGPAEYRAAALVALGTAMGDAALPAALAGLKDPDPVIRMAAAKALGLRAAPPAVEALIAALPTEKPEVAEAIVLALGASKAAPALPQIVDVLDKGTPELKRAAVAALATFAGPEAVAALRQRANADDPALRHALVQALAEKLRESIDPQWLVPILMSRQLNDFWIDSLRLMRLHGGEKTVPTLLSCLDFNVAWSSRNWWILETVKACPNPPAVDYTYDPNREGTDDELARNHRTLDALKDLAGPIAPLPLPAAKLPLPMLKTDPPIDFEPVATRDGKSLVIVSGFLKTTVDSRTSGSGQYSASSEYRELYQVSHNVHWLLRYPDLFPAMKITPQQAEQLRTLPSEASDRPPAVAVSTLLAAYDETPEGPHKEQAWAELLEAVQKASQDYHAAVTEFVAAARKILTAQQLAQLPALVEARHKLNAAPPTSPPSR